MLGKVILMSIITPSFYIFVYPIIPLPTVICISSELHALVCHLLLSTTFSCRVKLCKAVVVGDVAVGKTSMVNR